MFAKAFGLADEDDLRQLRTLLPRSPDDQHRVAAALRLASHGRHLLHAQRDAVMARQIEIGAKILYRLREELKVTGATGFNSGNKLEIPPEVFADPNTRLLPHMRVIMFPDYSTAFVVFPEQNDKKDDKDRPEYRE